MLKIIIKYSLVKRRLYILLGLDGYNDNVVCRRPSPTYTVMIPWEWNEDMNSNFRNHLETVLLYQFEKCETIEELNELTEEIVEQVELSRQSIEDTLDE